MVEDFFSIPAAVRLLIFPRRYQPGSMARISYGWFLCQLSFCDWLELVSSEYTLAHHFIFYRWLGESPQWYDA